MSESNWQLAARRVINGWETRAEPLANFVAMASAAEGAIVHWRLKGGRTIEVTTKRLKSRGLSCLGLVAVKIEGAKSCMFGPRQ